MDTCKERIVSALETLKPTTSWERSTASGQGLDGVLLGGRGFGVAMAALFNYLGSEYGNTFALGLTQKSKKKNEMTMHLFLFSFLSVIQEITIILTHVYVLGQNKCS